MKKFAFTLIEVLTIIVLISTLLAILMPVFSQVRRKSYQTVCASNMRQIGMAISMYAQDNDDLYPLASDDGRLISCGKSFYPEGLSEFKNPSSIVSLLGPYTSSPKIWECKNDVGLRHGGVCWDANSNVVDVSASEVQSLFRARKNSYFYRVELGYRQIKYPASAFTLGKIPEELGSSVCGILMDAGPFWHGDGTGLFDERINLLYADGHVKSVESHVPYWDYRLSPDEFVIP